MTTSIEGGKRAPAFPIPSAAVQKQSLDTVLRELDTSGKGRVSTLANAERLSKYIDTNGKARQSLALAEKHILEAHSFLKNYNFLDKMFGLAEANYNLLLGNWNSIQKIKARLPKDDNAAPSDRDAKVTALLLLQALDNLRFTDKLVAESASMSYARLFVDGLKTVLGFIVDEVIVPGVDFIANRVIKPAATAAMPILLPVAIGVGGFLIVKAIATKKATE